MSSSRIADARESRPVGSRVPSLSAGLVAAFLLANLLVRGHALLGWDAWTPRLALAGIMLLTLLGLVRPQIVPLAVPVFGVSFLLYGFHSYRLQSQFFELVVTALALVLLVRAPGRMAPRPPVSFSLLGGYAALATLSLLLLPVGVLEHRMFLEGTDLGRAALNAFPKDPLYPIACADRLWLYVLFAALLAAQSDASDLYRRVFKGIAWAAIAAAVLGLLDFAGWLPLDRYNLSSLFYGSRYRRLQSTFGNPAWFACFAACTLPLALLELHRARGRARLVLALVPPALAAALFLSGSRAAWLAVGLLAAAAAAAALDARRHRVALPSADGATWLALGATVAVVAWLAGSAMTLPAEGVAGATVAPQSRFEGLSRELGYRGLGLTSPRRVASEYALALARLKPLLGLGYESFNLHLTAQLEIPGSPVSRVVNTAVAADPSETVFDDSHNTYLQVLVGTGALGLLVWLAALGAGLWAALGAWRRQPSGQILAALLALLLFHFYGLFQGMSYVPVTFFLYPLLLGYVATLEGSTSDGAWRLPRWGWIAGVALVTVAVGVGYARDNGFASLKRRLGVTAYLPDERSVYEGFYRAEAGATGEFRWMRRRAIVNVDRAAPFSLRFACEHPDADREPVVLSLRLDGRELRSIVFRRPGVVEQRFDPTAAGSLRLVVSRTFRPGASDRRELGIAVSAIRWD